MRYAPKQHFADEAIDLGYGFLPNKQPKHPSFDLSGHQYDLDDARRITRDEERRRRPRPESPDSKTGGKLATPSERPSLSIDWLRMSGPRSQRHEALSLLSEYLGSATSGKGRHFLNSGFRFGNAGIYFDSDDDLRQDHCLVDIPGEGCSEFTFEQIREVMHELLLLGFKITRVDVALDLFTKSDLIDNVYNSCMSGELCRARRFKPQYEQSGAVVTAHGCNIGRRGKDGSGRYLRVYDKGLETQEEPQGTWVRWEAELSDEPGQEFALQFVQTADYTKVALQHALGVCDFREVTGDHHIDRRPRCAWFQELLEEIRPTRVVKDRPKSTLHSWKRWMQTAVLPRMYTIAEATGNTVETFVAKVFGEQEPDPELLEDDKARALCIELDVRPSHALERIGNRRLILATSEYVHRRHKSLTHHGEDSGHV